MTAPQRTARAGEPPPPEYVEAEQALLRRWPETRLEPSLERIGKLVDLLGNPQTNYPVLQITGTNGKSSTARMIDALLRSMGLRTGRFTSPHLQSMTERISIDGDQLSFEDFARLYAEVSPYADVVDRSSAHPLSFFELMTGMAYAAFADAPVDAAVLEVGMGGSWDATSVVDAQVAVVTPVAVDHEQYLGDTPELIATEKAGIIKPGAMAVLAEQTPEASRVLVERVVEVGATLAREGVDFGVSSRVPALGGQSLVLQGLGREYDEVFLPLFGEHQARNAALALAAVEGFAGGVDLDPDVIREGFADVTSPGRLEVARRSPAIVLDAAHNPAGARSAVAAVQEAFSFSPLIGVLGVMADKDAPGSWTRSSRSSPRWCAPRPRPVALCPPASSVTWPPGSSGPTECTSADGLTTRSTWPSLWQSRAGSPARRSARAASL
jgi:dihydrofolate synthase/folylpolyglutamate synthase